MLGAIIGLILFSLDQYYATGIIAIFVFASILINRFHKKTGMPNAIRSYLVLWLLISVTLAVKFGGIFGPFSSVFIHPPVIALAYLSIKESFLWCTISVVLTTFLYHELPKGNDPILQYWILLASISGIFLVAFVFRKSIDSEANTLISKASEFLTVIRNYSGLNFSIKAETDGKNQIFDHLAEGLNFMGNQLNQSVENLKSKQKTLVNSQKQIVQSAKLASLGEMSSGLAHEINNPLFVASGNLDKLSGKISQNHRNIYEEYSRYFDNIDQAHSKIRKIIDHMRDFSRESSTDVSEVDVNSVIEKSVDFLSEQFKDKQILVNLFLTNRSTMVMADFNKFEQVIINLLSNSRDALEGFEEKQTGKIVEISTSSGDSEVQIVFKDNGPGMEEDVKEKVFDAFFTTKPVGAGTGLGLSVSYGIIQEFHGSITVESELNKGTTFTIKVPAAIKS